MQKRDLMVLNLMVDVYELTIQSHKEHIRQHQVSTWEDLPAKAVVEVEGATVAVVVEVDMVTDVHTLDQGPDLDRLIIVDIDWRVERNFFRITRINPLQSRQD